MFMLISDYDRTLTNKELDLCMNVMNDIMKLKETVNMKFIVASGRTLDFLQNKLSNYADGFVAENGAVIYHDGRKEVFGKEEADKIRDALKGEDLVYFGEIIGYALIETEKTVKSALTAKGVNFSIERNKNSIMIMPPFINKGYGISRIIDSMKLKGALKIAMGDDENDITMLNVADFPVALANSDERLKSIAKLVTKSDYCNGVQELLDLLKVCFDAKLL